MYVCIYTHLPAVHSYVYTLLTVLYWRHTYTHMYIHSLPFYSNYTHTLICIYTPCHSILTTHIHSYVYTLLHQRHTYTHMYIHSLPCYTNGIHTLICWSSSSHLPSVSSLYGASPGTKLKSPHHTSASLSENSAHTCVSRINTYSMHPLSLRHKVKVAAPHKRVTNWNWAHIHVWVVSIHIRCKKCPLA